MDVFINDIITITNYDPTWVERAKIASIMVIHTIFRPLQSSELMKWGEPISIHKPSGEFFLVERNACLDCYIKNFSLQVFIPKEKYSTWVQDIRVSLSSTKIKSEKLESLIVNLNNDTYIIPPCVLFTDHTTTPAERG